MKKMNAGRILPFAVLAAWMAVIYMLSAQNGSQSGETSGRVMALLMRLFPIDIETWAGSQAQAQLHALVRTAAHFTEFAVLGMLSLWAVSGVTERYPWAIALGLSSLYAALDEWHQAYVPGRAAQVTDWLVDSLGAAAGIGLILCILFLWKRWGRKREKE